MKKASGGENSEVPTLHGRSRMFVCGLCSPVVGLHLVGHLTSGRFCRVCLGTGDFLRPQGAITPGFYPFQGGWVYCLAPEVPQKGECWRGRRYFWPCWTCVGFGPATGSTWKQPSAIFVHWWDTPINNRGLRRRSQRPLGSTQLGSYVIVVASTSPPLLVADFFSHGPFRGYERSPSAGRSISGGH